MENTKIKLENISSGKEQKVFNPTQKKYLPDNYYTYDIHRHLKTDFHNLSPKKNTHINICCFKIIESRPNKIIQHPFLQYLLYKYPKNIKKAGNICIFPFEIYKSGDVLDTAKKMIKTLFDKSYNPKGYIENKYGIFIFYNIEFHNVLILPEILNDNKHHYVWSLMDEICNQRKYITFDIHKSVTNLFLQNTKLIYLKDKNKSCIEIPSVAYVGESKELLNYIATMGIKASAIRLFGPYYYFNTFEKAVRHAGWSSNYEKREIFNKSITDENGQYIQGGLVRFAIFLGNYRVVLDRKTDPMIPYVNLLEEVDKPTKKIITKLNKGKGKWAEVYDSIIISNFENKKRHGYFVSKTEYILKKFNSFTSLSIHIVDNNTLGPFWDLDSVDYNIK
tara:strand:+ start:5 stop:1177 length:1173 start_codon:yes stop_codon:yes gene_type:complete